MSRPLRVLVADDSVYDCMLLVKELRRGGFEPRYARVDSREALRKALPAEPWDIVLLDNTIPDLDVRSVLEDVRTHDSNLAVIVISDVSGDEAAVTAMTAGARDYLLREKLDRLIPAVERIYSSVDKKRSGDRESTAPRSTDELLKLLIEATSEIITVLNSDGTVRFASPSIERSLGYRPDEIAGISVLDRIHADDSAPFRTWLADLVKQPDTTRSAAIRFRHKDGSWRTLDCVGRNMLSHPAIGGVVLDARDVTDRQGTPEGHLARAETRGRTPSNTTAARPGGDASAADSFVLRPTAAPIQSIGRYCVLQLIGEGGMGTVYKAHDPKLDRLVAIKLPRFDVPRADLDVVVQRFLREARSAAQVRHPNVCPIYDVDERDQLPFVVMAYVDGQSLADMLRARPHFADIAQAVRLARQVACGLKAVHSHGIVHRDLKPANILIDRDGQALLTDFGIARPENETQRLTVHGAVIGTPGYMAPEQAASEGERIGPWTDLYSLGIMLYNMLTGRLPFEGSGLTVLLKQLDQTPPAPSTLRPELDSRLEAIVLRAISRRPSDRYQTAQELIDAFDQWLVTAPNREAPTANFHDSTLQGE